MFRFFDVRRELSLHPARLEDAEVNANSEAPFEVVLNHFSVDGASHLRLSTLFAASLSLRDALVSNVTVVDGSPSVDEELRASVERIGGRYHHEGRKLGFAEGYNIGAKLTSAKWLVLSASDIYPSLDLFQQALKAIETFGEEVGCIIPHLTKSDLPIQESRWYPQTTCSVPLMTLNLNVFRRDTFFELGGVPTEYSGAFNDVDLSIKILERGLKILMIPALCNHFGRLTWETSSSDYKYINDRETFSRKYPSFVDLGYFWDLDLYAVIGGWSGLMIKWALKLCPVKRRMGLSRRLLMLLPALRRA